MTGISYSYLELDGRKPKDMSIDKKPINQASEQKQLHIS